MSFDPLLKLRQASPEPYAPREVHHGDQTPPITIADTRIDALMDRVEDVERKQAAQEKGRREALLKIRQAFLMAANAIGKLYFLPKKTE